MHDNHSHAQFYITRNQTEYASYDIVLQSPLHYFLALCENPPESHLLKSPGRVGEMHSYTLSSVGLDNLKKGRFNSCDLLRQYLLA